MVAAETTYEQGCAAGSHLDPDNGDCTLCAAWTFKSTAGTGVFSSCPNGTSSEPGSDALTDCTCITGYTAESDGIVCSPCAVDYYKSTTGAGVCSSCPTETSSEPGSDELADC
ncbi:hypothetical protein T484DRAFT_1649451, partial [Baffinella frigidus]